MKLTQKTINILFFNSLVRLAYRTVVRGLFIVVSLGGFYLLLVEVFPAIDRRSPIVLAGIATYFIAAYALFPLAIRIIRVVSRPRSLPRFATTPDGFVADPINVSVVGSKEQLINAFELSGWSVADKRTPATLLRAAKAMLLNQEYSTAPFSNLNLFGRSQDIGFQKSVKGKRFERHHVRFWDISKSVADDFEDHVGFWQRAHHNVSDKSNLWVGAAIKDVGIGVIRYHGQVTHAIDPDTNGERDLIARDLKRSGVTASIKKVRAGLPLALKNRVLSNTMIADGKIAVIKLK